MKAQGIRLLDVFVVGPVMMYAGLQNKKLDPWMRYSLIAIGVSTVFYNGRNYLILEKQKRELIEKQKQSAPLPPDITYS